MSDDGVHRNEMRRQQGLSDSDVEAILSGRAPEGRDDLARLATLANDVRATAAAAAPPRAGDELARVLTVGLVPDQPATPATSPRRLPPMKQLLGSTTAKVAGAVVAVVAGVGGLGVAGALPGPVQTGFDKVVPAVAPNDDKPATHDVSDDKGTAKPEAPEAKGATESTNTKHDSSEPTTTSTEKGAGNGLGGTVAGNVNAGSVDGTRVSDLAHQRNDARKAEDTKGTEVDNSGPGKADDHGTEATDPSESSDDKGEAPKADDNTPPTVQPGDDHQSGADHPSGDDHGGSGDHGKSETAPTNTTSTSGHGARGSDGSDG